MNLSIHFFNETAETLAKSLITSYTYPKSIKFSNGDIGSCKRWMSRKKPLEPINGFNCGRCIKSAENDPMQTSLVGLTALICPKCLRGFHVECAVQFIAASGIKTALPSPFETVSCLACSQSIFWNEFCSNIMVISKCGSKRKKKNIADLEDDSSSDSSSDVEEEYDPDLDLDSGSDSSVVEEDTINVNTDDNPLEIFQCSSNMININRTLDVNSETRRQSPKRNPSTNINSNPNKNPDYEIETAGDEDDAEGEIVHQASKRRSFTNKRSRRSSVRASVRAAMMESFESFAYSIVDDDEFKDPFASPSTITKDINMTYSAEQNTCNQVNNTFEDFEEFIIHDYIDENDPSVADPFFSPTAKAAGAIEDENGILGDQEDIDEKSVGHQNISSRLASEAVLNDAELNRSEAFTLSRRTTQNDENDRHGIGFHKCHTISNQNEDAAIDKMKNSTNDANETQVKRKSLQRENELNAEDEIKRQKRIIKTKQPRLLESPHQHHIENQEVFSDGQLRNLIKESSIGTSTSSSVEVFELSSCSSNYSSSNEDDNEFQPTAVAPTKRYGRHNRNEVSNLPKVTPKLTSPTRTIYERNPRKQIEKIDDQQHLQSGNTSSIHFESDDDWTEEANAMKEILSQELRLSAKLDESTSNLMEERVKPQGLGTGGWELESISVLDLSSCTSNTQQSNC